MYTELRSNQEALSRGWIPEWPLPLRVEVGAFLLDLATKYIHFRNDFTREDDVPVFTHKIIPFGGKKQGIIRVHERVMSLLKSNRENFLGIPCSFPMLIIPNVWLTINSGGYLLRFPNSPKLVRTKEDPIQLAILEECASRGDLTTLMTGLDILGRTPWTINQRVLEVALELWNKKTLDVSTLKPIPVPVDFNIFIPKEQFATHEAYVEYIRRTRASREEYANSHSSLCDTNYKLEIARHVQENVVVYFLIHCSTPVDPSTFHTLLISGGGRIPFHHIYVMYPVTCPEDYYVLLNQRHWVHVVCIGSRFRLPICSVMTSKFNPNIIYAYVHIDIRGRIE